MTGNMVIVEGDREVKDWLIAEPEHIDDWLYELVDEVSFFAAGRLRERAPGGISGLVDIDLANELDPGHFEAVAGVEPDITEETFGRGLGSDPADYPVYVEVGTGIFGEFGTPIEAIPGHLMGPISAFSMTGIHDSFFFTKSVKGQKPQHYARESFEDTVGWLPARIEVALHELGRRSR